MLAGRRMAKVTSAASEVLKRRRSPVLDLREASALAKPGVATRLSNPPEGRSFAHGEQGAVARDATRRL